MFFSASTGGFYSSEIHGANMPTDVVEITSELHSLLLEGQARGKVISSDESGYPFLAEKVAPSFQVALSILNNVYQADLQKLSASYSMAILADGASEAAKVANIRAQYIARKDLHTANVAALKLEYGV